MSSFSALQSAFAIISTRARDCNEASNLAEDLLLATYATVLRRNYGGHWGEDREYPVSQWMENVASGDTRLGYWEWVVNAAVGNASDPEPDVAEGGA